METIKNYGSGAEPDSVPQRKPKPLVKLRTLVEGQGLVEYALILLLVAIVVIAILTLLGPQIGSMFSQVKKGIS